MQVESAGRETENVRAGDIGGHEICSALHSLKAKAADARQRLHSKRLRESRDAFNDRVPSAHENHEKLIDYVALAYDDLRKLLTRMRCEGG
jgi:hypothetical protein